MRRGVWEDVGLAAVGFLAAIFCLALLRILAEIDMDPSPVAVYVGVGLLLLVGVAFRSKLEVT